MLVDHLSLKNFKSFREATVDLRQVSVVIGQSAAGKSNLILAIRLLRDIAARGLAAAVALQGGPRLLQNIQESNGEPLTIEVGFTLPATGTLLPLTTGGSLAGTYSLSLLCSGDEFTITDDRLVLRFPVPGGREPGARGTVTIRHQQDRIEYSIDLPADAGVTEEEVIPPEYRSRHLDAGHLLLESSVYPMPDIAAFFSEFAIYHPDPRRLKQGTVHCLTPDQDENEGNLARMLDQILAVPETGKRFMTLVQDLLPFIKEMTVSRSPDQTLQVQLRESYAAGVDIPASSLSDGTITLLALIAALYFTNHPLMVFEDPGTPVHPNLLATLVNMFYDASSRAQLVVVTHSPEIVRHVHLDDLLLVRRDRAGFSEITRPAESREVRTFIEEGMDPGDLYQQNLLGL
ncbi:AAA family ATPase [Methanosphaerula subterraneus]|uniref:AAA family ATPase n=1 Tax=Methanosphaerula subterraneus TaxID=3350244 RepID=UPI003F85B494